MGENYSVVEEKEMPFKTIQIVEVECLARHWWQIRIISNYDGEIEWKMNPLTGKPLRIFGLHDARVIMEKMV